MYLREMGTVPLLTREGEVEIAKRIERAKLAVIKSISRPPTIAKVIMTMGDALKNDERSLREPIGRAHVRTTVTYHARMPCSA